MNKRGEALKGLRAALPIMLGYAPLAFAYGVLAVQAGLSPIFAIAMSVFVYAGASQFMALALIAAGASFGSIVLTVFVVNLRHVLMSASLSSHLGLIARPRLAWLAWQLTDETFAVISARVLSTAVSSAWIAGLQIGAHASWILGSIIGAWAGSGVVDPARWGLDFALTAMFLALLLAQIKSGKMLLVAASAIAVHRLMQSQWSGPWPLIGAAIVAAGFGALLHDMRFGVERREQA